MVRVNTYISEVTSELKKVSWPTRAQTIEMTVLVIGVSVLIAVYLGGLDFILQYIMNILL